jgi:hypothetical protein
MEQSVFTTSSKKSNKHFNFLDKFPPIPECGYYEKYTSIVPDEKCPQKILDRALYYAKQLDCFSMDHTPWTWSIRLIEKNSSNPLKISINIIRVEGALLIEFQRRWGNSIYFNEAYEQFKALYNGTSFVLRFTPDVDLSDLIEDLEKL